MPDRFATLQSLCDTYVPRVQPPSRAPDMGGFWQRRASDLAAHRAVAEHIATRLPAADRDGLHHLVDLLGVLGFRHLPLTVRHAQLRVLAGSSALVARGLDALRALALLHFYADPLDGGPNPNWAVLGYPGPPVARTAATRVLQPVVAHDGDALHADVCVVGSGAGGGVAAGVLASHGLDVIVLEAGGHAEAGDFAGDELSALEQLYWRGGYTPTADGNVTLLAGATLGGGTTVNWTNCVVPPDAVREQWAREHGLVGVEGEVFDGHVQAVLSRVSATQACNDVNGPNSRLRDAAQVLGWSWRLALRNTDPACYEPTSAGQMGFGDRSGSKQGMVQTYLADAADAGARILVHCRARRVRTAAGRASAVEAVQLSPAGASRVTVKARAIVVACGALETPALLLRSGIGGPAAGRHLRLHPVGALVGFYDQPQDPWWGPPQTVIVDEFADDVFLECPHLGPGLVAATLPWRSGRDHKLLVGRVPYSSAFIALVRDRGEGRVTIDNEGEPVVTYPLDEPVDRHHLLEALGAMARAHSAAGARAIVDLAPARALWRRGEGVDRFVRRLGQVSFGARGRPLFSAHQMGSARMGTTRDGSVADPDGQLHDVRGVWIADTSAFPTAVGVNPMVTCMALARRTAHALLAAGMPKR